MTEAARKLSDTQKKLLEALIKTRRERVVHEFKIFGLRSAIGFYKTPIAVVDWALGLKRVDSRSLKALERAGLVELKATFSHTVNHWVSPFSGLWCHNDHYETSYTARITAKGSALFPNKVK